MNGVLLFLGFAIGEAVDEDLKCQWRWKNGE